MAALYLSAPIGVTSAWGVTAMALGTAVLLVAATEQSDAPITTSIRLVRGVEWTGRRSYELYLFHLVVLALLRTWLPARTVVGGWRLLLLAVFLIVSAAAASAIAYCMPSR